MGKEKDEQVGEFSKKSEKKRKSILSILIKIFLKVVAFLFIFFVAIGVGTYLKNKYIDFGFTTTKEENLLESSVKEIGEFATLEYDYRATVTFKGGKYLTERNLVMIYDGVIKAGIDTADILVEPSKDDKGNLTSVTITLPDAKILSHEDLNHKTIYESSKLTEVSSDDRKNKLNEEKNARRSQFIVDGYLDEAYEKACNAIEDLIHLTYGESIKVEFIKIPTDETDLTEDEKLIRLTNEYPDLVKKNNDGSTSTGMTEEMIDYFYSNYYGNSFEELIQMYIDDCVPSKISKQITYINEDLSEYDLELKPYYVYYGEDDKSYGEFLYYEVYKDGEDMDQTVQFVYDPMTNQYLVTLITLEDVRNLDYSDYSLILYNTIMGEYSDTIKSSKSNTDKYINKIMKKKEYKSVVYDDYCFYHFSDEYADYLAIMSTDVAGE